jgi:L-fuconolactonase
MPDVPMIDAHVHLWDPDSFRMPWLDRSPALNRRIGIEEYATATAGLDIAGFVYLEVDVAPEYALIEASSIARLAEQQPLILAIVPFAPLEYGNRVVTYLEAIVALGPRIKGVRRLTQGEPDPAFCLRQEFVEGASQLAKFGLSCDLCCTWEQLGPTIELVRRCPETSFILDHLGKPNIASGALDPWRGQITSLASLPNVVCKISGAVTEADHERWAIDDVKPFVLHALDAFGEDRVLFGSDWPVATLASTYRRWVETLEILTADAPSPARRKLWADNARRVYRLTDERLNSRPPKSSRPCDSGGRTTPVRREE